MKYVVKDFLLVMAFSALITNSATAADIEDDIDIDALVEQTQSNFVEFGSGWYLRGDITYNLGGKQSTGTKIVNFAKKQEPLHYDYDDAIGFRAGFGYYLTPSFRGEFSAEAILKSKFSGENPQTFEGSRTVTDKAANGTEHTEKRFFDKDGNIIPAGSGGSKTSPINGSERLDYSYSASNFMVNGYYDLPSFNTFTPYIGAGVGVARLNYSVKKMWNCVPADQTEACGNPAGKAGQEVKDYVVMDNTFVYWRPSWQLSAGVGVRVSDNISLDLGYSYLNLGKGSKFKYKDGRGFTPTGNAIHRFNVGLRYEIW